MTTCLLNLDPSWRSLIKNQSRFSSGVCSFLKFFANLFPPAILHPHLSPEGDILSRKGRGKIENLFHHKVNQFVRHEDFFHHLLAFQMLFHVGVCHGFDFDFGLRSSRREFQ